MLCATFQSFLVFQTTCFVIDLHTVCKPTSEGIGQRVSRAHNATTPSNRRARVVVSINPQLHLHIKVYQSTNAPTYITTSSTSQLHLHIRVYQSTNAPTYISTTSTSSLHLHIIVYHQLHQRLLHHN